MAVSFDPGPPRVIGTPRPAFDYRYFRPFNPIAYHDIAPDGRFVFVGLPNDASDGDSAAASLTVVQNWFEELRRNVPAD